MKRSHFASPQRTSPQALDAEIRQIAGSEVVNGLLKTMSGLVAVLDENRQVVALNDAFLEFLSVEDASGALGLRPGEILECVHAHDEPAGCGTTPYCSTCGAALSIVASLSEDIPAERMCALSAVRGGNRVELALRVSSHPIQVNDARFLLLFLQDVTAQEKRAALERTFFHDITNLVSRIIQASEVLEREHPSHMSRLVAHTASRLHSEIAIQRRLMAGDAAAYQPTWREVTATAVLRDLASFYETHPVSARRQIEVGEDCHAQITTDVSALCRVLCNMVTNALEATEAGGTVRIWAEEKEEHLRFCVWNQAQVPEDVRFRVFQRSFSTKKGAGRGIGGFSSSSERACSADA